MTQLDSRSESPTQVEGPCAEVVRYFALEQPKLRAYIRSLVFDPGDADDVLQDVALVAIQNSHRYDDQWPLESWLIGIAKKRVLKFLEARQRQKLRFSADIIDALTELEEVEPSGADHSLDTLQVCLTKLDDTRRSLLIRRHAPGVTARALAKEIGYTDTRMSRLINGLYATLMKCVQQQLASDGGVS